MAVPPARLSSAKPIKKVWMTIALATLSFIQEPRPVWGVDWEWGAPLIVVTVIVHVLSMGFITQKAVQIHGNIMERRRTPAAFVVVMGATALLTTILHAFEAGIWAYAYCLIGALPDFKSAMLYSLGAMTTYGHQNLYLQEHWRLIGPIEALNGSLLVGLTTAFLFWLIQEVSPKNRANH